jgi:hypothetical protein
MHPVMAYEPFNYQRRFNPVRPVVFDEQLYSMGYASNIYCREHFVGQLNAREFQGATRRIRASQGLINPDSDYWISSGRLLTLATHC